MFRGGRVRSRCKRAQQSLAFCRQRRLEFQRFAAERMGQAQHAGMQEHAVEAAAGTAVPRASALFSAKSPYLSSPAITWPAPARWTRIWCVRPVFSVTSSRLKPGSRRATRTSVIERRPSAWSASTVRTRRSPAPSRYLCSGLVDHLVTGRPAADDQRGIDLRDRRSLLRCAELLLQREQRRALLRDQQQPRCFLVEPMHEFEERCARTGAAQLLDDAELTPLPPCTATPAGLSIAIRQSSSKTIGNSRARRAGRRSSARRRQSAPAECGYRRRSPAGYRPPRGPC